jgi:nitrous oxide reductase accessory protein NosL
MQKAVLLLVLVGALVLAGCSSTTTRPPLSPSQQLTSIACKDIVTTMTPKEGTGTIDLGLPFEKLIVAVDNAHNAQLRSELAAFQAAAATGGDIVKFSNAMLRTCRQLGFGASTR